jgi:hypothetical protein
VKINKISTYINNSSTFCYVFIVVQHRKETKKTGGGPPPENPDPLDEMAAAVIGEASLTGIPGGGMEVGGTENGMQTSCRV